MVFFDPDWTSPVAEQTDDRHQSRPQTRLRRPGRGTPFGLVTVLLADTDFIEVGRPE
jgi:hypothetical protein